MDSKLPAKNYSDKEIRIALFETARARRAKI